jgi:hypothetical protein
MNTIKTVHDARVKKHYEFEERCRRDEAKAKLGLSKIMHRKELLQQHPRIGVLCQGGANQMFYIVTKDRKIIERKRIETLIKMLEKGV